MKVSLPWEEITNHRILSCKGPTGISKVQLLNSPRVTHPWWPWHPAGVEGSTLFPIHLPRWPRSYSSPDCFTEKGRTDFCLPYFRHCLGIDFLPLIKWIYLHFSGFYLFPLSGFFFLVIIFFSSHMIPFENFLIVFTLDRNTIFFLPQGCL